MSRSFFALGFVAAGAIFASQALAEDFHGFDPATFDGAMLSADQLKAAVADAMAKTPPKNGKNYVIGFANLDAGITFCAKVEEGIEANAKAAGIELYVADNHLDGADRARQCGELHQSQRRLRHRIPDRRQFRRRRSCRR